MATEFICSLKQDGSGDYTTLSAWNGANQCNLTVAATKVFPHAGITGTIADGSTVTGKVSNATGIATHVTPNQILVHTIAGGPFQNGEQVYETDGVNFVTISSAGGSAIAVIECYKAGWTVTPLDNGLVVTGWTTDTTNHVIVRAATGNQHSGYLKDGSTYTGFTIKRTGLNTTGIRSDEDGTIFEGIAVEMAGTGTEVGVRFSRTGEIKNFLVAGAVTKGYDIVPALGTTVKMSNSIAYDCGLGYDIGSTGTIYGYNLTAVDCTAIGFSINEAGATSVINLKNCFADNCTKDFEYTDDRGGSFTCDYCASSDDTADDQGGTGNRENRTFIFVDEPADNFQPSASDAGAKDYGTDLSGDGNYPITEDIVGTTRSVPWDIGAWSAATTANGKKARRFMMLWRTSPCH